MTKSNNTIPVVARQMLIPFILVTSLFSLWGFANDITNPMVRAFSKVLLMSNFEGSFLYNDGKEIRIPVQENGELIQIKVALTAAKENVEQGADNAVPGVAAEKIDFESEVKTAKPVVEATEEEKNNVNDLLKALGL